MISTHVLDTEAGLPAVGVRVELYRDDELVSATETDEDGRVARLGDDLETGRYRLVFHPASPFFRRIQLDLELDSGSHYHVPLLLSPYACTIYRGS